MYHPSQVPRNSPPAEGCPQGGVVNNPVQILTTINQTGIVKNLVVNLPGNPALKKLAKEKRKAGILSEVLFWQQVHKGKFHKIDFDRQRVIGNYIVDFYVKSLGLVVEIDGASHTGKEIYDTQRTAFLEDLGLRVYHISDFDVKKNLAKVMLQLEVYIVEQFGLKTAPVSNHPSKGMEF